MAYDKATYDDQDPVGGALYFMRDDLDCEQLGISVLEAEPGWTGMEHDHADEGQEEVYLLLEGAATITVEGEALELDAGEAVRVDPDATRQLEVGDEESRMVIVGAP